MEDWHLVLGIRETWGQQSPFVLSAPDRRHHLYIIGKSGKGKTTLLRNPILQDIVLVIDELHSFISDVRGVHLQSLLSRLIATTGCSPRLVGLSATLANPESARAFIAPDDVNSVQVIEDASATREIKFGIRTFLQRPPGGKVPLPRLTSEQALTLAESFVTPARADGKLIANWVQQNAAPVTSKNNTIDELDEIADDIIKHFRLSESK